VAAALAACGDDLAPADLLGQLRALPGIHEAERVPTQTAGFEYYVLRFAQPVDHDQPDGPTFLQRVSLLHRDDAQPMIVLTSGYWDYYRDFPAELTRMLGANQISIEHRYFGESRPEPADWSKLTIAQMAGDQHRIVTALRTLYAGAFVATGGSKGGMTSVYYRRFFPDDVEATVPYVAPISFGAPDPRYASFVDTLGPDACREAIREVATELLANRRAAILDRVAAQAEVAGHAYTRIALGPAVESAILSVEWSFWQYLGAESCGAVPPTSASDDELFAFLEEVSPVSDNADASIGRFDAYYHQAAHQLGFPSTGAEYLAPYKMYGGADYLGAWPAGVPTYDDGAAMQDIDDFVQARGERLLFVYGEWDPWTGGQFELGAATDSLRLIQARGSHGARLSRLDPADRELALARLEAWTGVRPGLAASARSTRMVREPRVPPAMLRALRAGRL
jgi:hypothetical protein